MKIIELSAGKQSLQEPSVGCIGYFDGVHIGHQKLMKTALKQAKKLQIPFSVITFNPDPIEIFKPCSKHKHITDLNTKMELFSKFGCEVVYVINFDKSFCQLSPDEFIEFLNEIGIKHLVCGFDFSFGYLAKGDTKYLLNSKLKDFNVEVIGPVNMNNEKISSTRIIRNIIDGNVNKAIKLLGHPLIITGTIKDNIFFSDLCVLPQKGKYKIILNNKEELVNIEEQKFEINYMDCESVKIELVGNVNN